MGSTFSWTDTHTRAFEKLKQAVSSTPVLCSPNPDLPCILHTDASDTGVGAVLMQDFGRGPQPIAFESHRLTPAEQNYPTHERELLAIVTHLKSGVTMLAFVT